MLYPLKFKHIYKDKIWGGNRFGVLATIHQVYVERKKPNTLYLPKTYIAIEDERFADHFGVDIKRTESAIGSYIIHFGKSSFGGGSLRASLEKGILIFR